MLFVRRAVTGVRLYWCLVTALVVVEVLLHADYVSAGELTLDLQQLLATGTDDDIPVIVHFLGQVNKQSFHDQITGAASGMRDKHTVLTAVQHSAMKEFRREHRAEYIRSLKSIAREKQKPARAYLKGYLHHPAARDLWMVNALAVTVPANRVATLARLPFVDRVGYDREIVLSGLPGSNGAVPTWNLEMINVPQLWSSGYTGSGTVVANMDTGVDGLHPDLFDKWRGGVNSWYNPYIPDSTVELPYDVNGHGTHTMGVIAGGNTSGTAIGIAPGAQWIAAKIFQDNLIATVSGIHAAFQWMLDPDGVPATDDAPDIINNSWGFLTNIGICDNEFDEDIDTLRTADISVVFSAGNEGPASNTGTSPATNSRTISVGSVNQFYAVASNSSRGPTDCSGDIFPTMTAPGVGIYTADLSFGLGHLLNPYTGVSGTSIAAPHITGVMALLKGAVNAATSQELEQALKDSALDLDVLGPDYSYGYGLVDAQAALLKLRCPAGSLDSDDDGYYDVCDNCSELPNTSQTDNDNDGYGNRCDIDLNNDLVVNILDIGLYRTAFSQSSMDADINGDGIVNILDIGYIRSMLFKPPGPSGLVP